MSDNELYPYRTSGKDVTNVSGASFDGSNLGRVLPRQNSAGSMQRTQTLGFGKAKIDGSTGTFTVGSDIGTNGIGSIPGSTTQSGFFQTDNTGKIVYTVVQGTELLYNPNDNYVNTVRFGFAPDDGRPGLWIAKPGKDATQLLQ